ncbi:MAG: DUF1501 domain-containing protein [Rudaea sp.]
MQVDRRKFIKQTLCAALGGASLYSALGNMRVLQAATRASSYAFSDYKALVCVFLYGGNDSFNTVVPYTTSAYNAYYGSSGVRSALALQRNLLHSLSDTTSSSGDGIAYALHPNMPELATLFNAGHAAIVANVGTLVGPVTQNAYQNGSPALPPQLYSHADQTAYWQSSPPSNAPVTGWGGRIADMVISANPSGIPTMTGLNGQDVFMRGDLVSGYAMNADSASTLDFPYDSRGEIETRFQALFGAGTQANAMERTYAARMNHSMATADIINAAIGTHSFSSFFPNATGYDLDTQLQSVAQLIWAANNNIAGYTGLKRQVFFVSAGGYDTHDGELASHSDILSLLSKALSGFYNALASTGLASKATAFTASDFGRTLTNNDGGTDHGWGSHHFVVGGAVTGKKFYGNGCGFSGQASNYGVVMPSLLNPTSSNYGSSPNLNDSGDGNGRLIPTTSVDQYAATLANWFGLSASDIGLIFPNLSNFSNSSHYNPASGYMQFMV